MIDSRGSGQELLIDRVTPRQRPSAEQIRLWASKQRIFVSSTMDDLREIRQAAAETISEVGAHPVLFETLGARTDDSRQAYTSEVRRSTIYIGILSRLYGIKLPSGYSATQEEYQEALEHGKEILFFLDESVPDAERDGHLNRWLKELYQFHVVAKFRSVGDLSRLIKTSLEQLATDELTPWVKLGRIIFQATRIEKTATGHATTIALTTASQDPHITGMLGAMARERFGTPSLRLTYGRESFAVKIDSVEEIVDPLGINSLKVTCNILENQEQHQHKTSLLLFGGGYQSSSGSYTHRDLVRIALSGLVLGKRPPNDRMFDSMPRLDFKALYKQYGGEGQLFTKILELLCIEAIYEHGIVDRVMSFTAGKVRDGRIQVNLSAMLPRVYTNVEPDEVSLEGEIDLR